MVFGLYSKHIFSAKNSACKSYSHFFSKKFQHNCVSLDVNFNESLTNDIVSFEQLGPDNHFKKTDTTTTLKGIIGATIMA